jgi:Transposase IS200 like
LNPSLEGQSIAGVFGCKCSGRNDRGVTSVSQMLTESRVCQVGPQGIRSTGPTCGTLQTIPKRHSGHSQLVQHGRPPALPGRESKFVSYWSPSRKLLNVSRQAHEEEISHDGRDGKPKSYEVECKYHVVFIPKGRGKVLYAELRRHLGEVFRKLAEQKESRIEEGHLMPDHVHMMIAIPPKHAVSQVIGFIQGEERDSHGAGLRWAEGEFCGPALLGAWLLGFNRRSG